ncbi:MAG: WG repeat-containing protein [Bacteroidetes bacterium]|nr:WG repeat-containing protein [Bacteroidota bacterium]
MKTRLFFFISCLCFASAALPQSYYYGCQTVFRIGKTECGVVTGEGDTIIDTQLIRYRNNGDEFLLVSAVSLSDGGDFEVFVDTNGRFFSGKYKQAQPPYKGKALGIFENKLYLISAAGKEKEICDADYVYPFSEGIARVEKDGKMAYVNLDGKLITGFDFDIPEEKNQKNAVFQEGMACVKKDDQWVYLNPEGTFLTVADAFDIRSFSEGFAYCTFADEEGYYVDKSGKKKFGDYQAGSQFSEGYAVVLSPYGMVCIINSKGKEVFRSELDDISEFSRFSEGLAAIRNSETGFWGYINVKGERTIVCQFREAGDFSGGLTLVKLTNDEFALITTSGKIIFNFGKSYQRYLEDLKQIDFRKSDVFVFVSDQGNFLVDKSGKILAEKIEEWLCRQAGFIVQVIDSEIECPGYVLLDSMGKDLTGKCESISYFNGRYIWVKKDCKYAMIDKLGNVLTRWYDDLLKIYGIEESKRDLFEILKFYHNNTIPFRIGNKWGVLTQEGKELYDAKFDTVYHFRGGHAVAFQDGKPVLLDKTGNVLPLGFDNVLEFSRWVYIAEKGGKFGFISTEGKPVGEFVYDKIEIYPERNINPNSDKICGFGKIGGKEVSIDYFGKELDGM